MSKYVCNRENGGNVIKNARVIGLVGDLASVAVKMEAVPHQAGVETESHSHPKHSRRIAMERILLDWMLRWKRLRYV